jgi:hypothetical protein
MYGIPKGWLGIWRRYTFSLRKIQLLGIGAAPFIETFDEANVTQVDTNFKKN